MLWTALDDEAGDGDEIFGKDDCCLLFDSVGDGCAPVPGVKGLGFGLKAIGRQASRRPEDGVDCLMTLLNARKEDLTLKLSLIKAEISPHANCGSSDTVRDVIDRHSIHSQ
jgi:hypothetical protein